MTLYNLLSRFSLLIFLFCFLANLPFALAHHAGGGSTPQAKTDALLKEESISSGPLLNSPTASTLGRNHGSLGFVFAHARYNSIPADDAHHLHHEDRHVHGKNHEEFYNISLGFGLLEDLDLYLTAPIVGKNSIDVHDHDLLGKKEYAKGFGDMSLIAKYRFWKRWVEAAVIAGVKFPTGRTTAKRASGNKFDAELQPGTGSWDGEFGIALSRSFMRQLSLATSFQYFLHSEGAQDHEAGDVFRYNVGGSYLFRQPGRYPNLSAVLELNNEWALKDRSRHEKRVFDSGGTTIFISPGLNIHFTKNISAFWAMPVPIYQNLGGEHEETKYQLLAGLQLYF